MMEGCTIIGHVAAGDKKAMDSLQRAFGHLKDTVVVHCSEERLAGFLVFDGFWIGISHRPNWLFRKVLAQVGGKWQTYHPAGRVTAAVWQDMRDV